MPHPEPLRPVGDLDVASAPDLRADLQGAIAASPAGDVTLDLAQVTFLDSTALGVLVGALKSAQAKGGTLTLANLSPRLLQVFTGTGLDEAFGLAGGGTPDLVEQFGPRAEEASAILARYGPGEHHREVDRVRAAIVQLAKGDLDRLAHYAAAADEDHRDVLWWSESEA